MDGDGGLTGAATDLVRLAAIVATEDNSSALSSNTIAVMLNKAVTNELTHKGRAGYGFDGVNLGSGQFYAPKGGSLADSHRIFEVNGDWGLVGVWGGDPVTSPWYPYYLEQFSPQKDALMNEKDVFPHFGDASLWAHGVAIRYLCAN